MELPDGGSGRPLFQLRRVEDLQLLRLELRDDYLPQERKGMEANQLLIPGEGARPNRPLDSLKPALQKLLYGLSFRSHRQAPVPIPDGRGQQPGGFLARGRVGA